MIRLLAFAAALLATGCVQPTPAPPAKAAKAIELPKTEEPKIPPTKVADDRPPAKVEYEATLWDCTCLAGPTLTAQGLTSMTSGFQHVVNEVTYLCHLKNHLKNSVRGSGKPRSTPAKQVPADERAVRDRLYNALDAVARFDGVCDRPSIERWSGLFLAAGVELRRLDLTNRLETLLSVEEGGPFRIGQRMAFNLFQLACAGRGDELKAIMWGLAESSTVPHGPFRRFLYDVRDSAYRWTTIDEGEGEVPDAGGPRADAAPLVVARALTGAAPPTNVAGTVVAPAPPVHY